MTKIFGYSDDIVEIKNSNYKCDEIYCFNKDVRIKFTDGTVIRVGYSKPDCAIWWIEIEECGTATQKFTICDDENADIYSDIFEIDAEIKKYSVIKKDSKQNGRV